MQRDTLRNHHSPHLFSESFAFRGENLNLRYDKDLVIKNVSFSITKGEIVFITGRSGAGKSSLIKLLAGEVAPLGGKVIAGDPEAFIGRTFQDVHLLANLSLQDNLYFSYDSSLYKNRSSFTKSMKELCRFLNIEDKLKIQAGKANGGLKQKLALVRALLTRPQIILCDEPTSSCDRESSVRCFELLNHYNQSQGLTIIWASHNRELVKSFPGRILHLDDGKLVYSGHACFI